MQLLAKTPQMAEPKKEVASVKTKKKRAVGVNDCSLLGGVGGMREKGRGADRSVLAGGNLALVMFPGQTSAQKGSA